MPMSSGAFSNIQDQIDNYVTGVDKTHGIKMGVAIGLVTPGATALLFSTGPMVSRGGSPITLGPTTPFELGSVSKVFTTGIYLQCQGDNFGVTIGSMLG